MSVIKPPSSQKISNRNCKPTCIHKIVWHGIEIEVKHIAQRFGDFDHVEVTSLDCVALPITETGYRSLFILSERLAEHADPVSYVRAWLDHEADSDTWKRYEANALQLSLF